jgi:hypothetical protein
VLSGSSPWPILDGLGDGPSELEDSVIAPRRELELLSGGSQEALAGMAEDGSSWRAVAMTRADVRTDTVKPKKEPKSCVAIRLVA